MRPPTAVVETAFLRRCYVLFFIEIASRRVHLAGYSTNPTGRWIAQQARNPSRVLFDVWRRTARPSAGVYTTEAQRAAGVYAYPTNGGIRWYFRARNSNDQTTRRPTETAANALTERT